MIANLIARLTWPIVAIAAVLLFYEGVPFAKSIPFIGEPFKGRVDRVADLATERLNARLKSQSAANEAEIQRRIAEFQREQSAKFEAARREFEAKAAQAAKEKEADENRIKELLEARPDAGNCTVDDDLLNRLRNNTSR